MAYMVVQHTCTMQDMHTQDNTQNTYKTGKTHHTHTHRQGRAHDVATATITAMYTQPPNPPTTTTTTTTLHDAAKNWTSSVLLALSKRPGVAPVYSALVHGCGRAHGDGLLQQCEWLLQVCFGGVGGGVGVWVLLARIHKGGEGCVGHDVYNTTHVCSVITHHMFPAPSLTHTHFPHSQDPTTLSGQKSLMSAIQHRCGRDPAPSQGPPSPQDPPTHLNTPPATAHTSMGHDKTYPLTTDSTYTPRPFALEQGVCEVALLGLIASTAARRRDVAQQVCVRVCACE